MEYPKVSIIIPTYNRESTLKRSINSILNQTYKSFELIIVDDGSTDKTKEVVNSFNDGRIIYLYQQNKGACAARNYGISIARGKYIAFQDSDDEWLPNKLEMQLSTIRRTKSDFDICRMQTVENKEIVPSDTAINAGLNAQYIIGANFMSTQMLLIRKDVILAEKFDPSLPRFQDWDLAMRLYPKYKSSFTPFVLVKRYLMSDSITYNNNKAVQAYSILEKKYSNIYTKNPDRYSIYLYNKVKACGKSLSREEKLSIYKTSFKYKARFKTLVRIIQTFFGKE
ncbi:glycosyltransferase family 2 protein [Bifidobacterium felsineum]|uniref:Glycosyl transferase family 2 n=1 Tax=Bifidobacterium felsineum TaxID=2045440 RepID=A0A2M9HHX0_9BIFI|nr:glycosyltransferase family A protein [Bifidobacterium felsineum]PJM76389.1 glycosyl transferase family 2 [Bifidobacterium felsineum]